MFFQISLETIGRESNFEKTLSHIIFWGNNGVRDFKEFENSTLSIFREEFSKFNPNKEEEDYCLEMLTLEKKPWDKEDYSCLEFFLVGRIRKDIAYIKQTFYYQNPEG